MPQLTHDKVFKENGIPGLLSREGFDFAWTQYQTFIVDKLNLLTQGEFRYLEAAEDRGSTHLHRPRDAVMK